MLEIVYCQKKTLINSKMKKEKQKKTFVLVTSLHRHEDALELKETSGLVQPFVILEFFGGKDSSMARPVPLLTVVGRVLSSLVVQFKTVLRSDRMILLAMPPPL